MRCLITAGPTREYLDAVRYLSNGSSGGMGYALAAAAARRGWEVTVVSGPVSLPVPDGVTVRRVVSAADMLRACEPLFGACDLFIAVAAVADYRPVDPVMGKPPKANGEVTLRLTPTVDVLATLAARKRPGQMVVGFAAETDELERSARKKLTRKHCDWIVGNDVGRPGLGMDAPDNAVRLFGRHGRTAEFGPAPKSAVAEFILDRVTRSPGAG